MSDRSGFRTDIQGLRALAVTSVVAHHAHGLVPGGFVGVDLFFVISGFVITRSLMRERLRTGKLSVPSFYVRRVRRILPMGALVGVVTMIAGVVVFEGVIGRDTIARTGRSAALFVANFHLHAANNEYFAPFAERNPFLHTWSLSVEEQFYLGLPAILVVAFHIGRHRVDRPFRFATVAVLAMTVTSAAAAIWTVETGDMSWAFYAPHLRAWEFGVGVLLAFLLDDLWLGSRGFATAVGGAGLGMIVFALATYDPDTPFPGLAAVPPVIGTALVIAFAPGAPAIERSLGWAPFRWIGDRSYGWYLWHWPAIVIARAEFPQFRFAAAVAAIVSLGLAALSHRLLEEPVRRQSMNALAAASLLGMAVVVPVAVSELIVRDTTIAEPAEDGYFGTFTRAWHAGCGKERPIDDCTFADKPSQPVVLLIGDSHATALSDAVTVAADELGLGTVVFTQFGCPVLPRGVLDRRTNHVGLADRLCPAYQEEVVDLVDRLDPVIVVAAHRSPTYLDQQDPERDTTGFGPIKDADGTPAASEADAQRIWREGMIELVDQLDRPLLIVTTLPEFTRDTHDEVLLGGRSDVYPRLTLDEVEARRGDAVAIEQEIADARDGVEIFDPVPVMCDATGCDARGTEGWRYNDGDHVRASATRGLVPGIRDALRGLLTGA